MHVYIIVYDNCCWYFFMLFPQGASEAEQVPNSLPDSGNFRPVSWADGHTLPDHSDSHKFRPEWEYSGKHLWQKVKSLSAKFSRFLSNL